MKPGAPIVIERTANGWLVREEWPREHRILVTAEMHCFQHLEYDQLGVQSDATLFGFLKQHFASNPETEEPK